MSQISKPRIGEYLKIALQSVEDAGGYLSSRDVLNAMEKKLTFNEYELAPLEKTGNIRWTSVLHFFSIDCVKAGWLRKNAGVWYITDEGKEALKKFSPEEFILEANKKYKEWRKNNKKKTHEEVFEEPSETTIARQATFEQAIANARQEVVNYINDLDGYEFQDLVGALLRGMGFFTPFIAPKGKDGGIDIIAYKDPLGTISPRLKVQVKHRDQKVDAKEVREFISLLHDEDVGLIISSGGFTSDGEVEMRRSQRRLEKMGLDRFIELWEEHYEKMSESDRAHLPMRKISFLAPVRE
jgi:restriction system protein